MDNLWHAAHIQKRKTDPKGGTAQKWFLVHAVLVKATAVLWSELNEGTLK